MFPLFRTSIQICQGLGKHVVVKACCSSSFGVRVLTSPITRGYAAPSRHVGFSNGPVRVRRAVAKARCIREAVVIGSLYCDPNYACVFVN